MPTHNPSNERIKRRYFEFLRDAQRHSESTVDAVAEALARFEADTRFRDFKAFHVNQAVAFKQHLAAQRAQRSGEPLSKATMYATLSNLKRFFQWLAAQPGYRSRLTYTDAEYFNMSGKDARIATARRERSFPSVDQVKLAIAAMPAGSDIERRDRALVAFTLLTGARDSAIASMKLKHIDVVAGRVFQDAREVLTKNSKSFETTFFPVGGNVREIVVDWVRYLREELQWSDDDPLFPATRVVQGPSLQYEAGGLDRRHWSSASPIREVFRNAFVAAGLPYFNPHSLRKTLTQLGEVLCQRAEDFKAWSQNLGHEKVLTTFTSYGQVPSRRQHEIIAGLARPSGDLSPKVAEIVRTLARMVETETE